MSDDWKGHPCDCPPLNHRIVGQFRRVGSKRIISVYMCAHCNSKWELTAKEWTVGLSTDLEWKK